MIRVAIVDDHKMFRDGLQAMLSDENDINVIWTSPDTKTTLERLETDLPDVILMDLTLGTESGITLTKTVMDLHPSIKILAISMHYEDTYIVKVLENGASGYLLKESGGEEVVNAIRTVNQGNTYYSKHVSEVLIKHITKGTKPKQGIQIPLTKREIEILTLIANEYSNPEIAKELFISIRTVDTHRRNLLEKLDVKNTAGLVKHAVKFGLIDIK